MAAQEVESVLPLFNECRFSTLRVGFGGSGLGGGIKQSLAFVVLMRQDGFLLALPDVTLPREIIYAGNVVGSQEIFGPSTKVEVSCVYMGEESWNVSADGMVGQVMDILPIDASNDVLPGYPVLCQAKPASSRN
eukprot:s198_g22.t1